ncbi:MAG: S-layer homology domain-containing protein [Eubacteriales bacterium]
MNKTLKKVALAAALTAALSTSIFAFSDVSGDALEMAVNSLQSMNVVNGYADNTFKPDNTVTRAEFSKMVVMASSSRDSLSTTGTTSPFSDVAASNWARSYITLAYNLGYVNGNGDGSFSPDANITLGEASTVALRMLGYTSADIGYSWPEDYTDAARELGLLDDVSATGDYQSMTRGDIAQMLYNMVAMETSDGDEYTEVWASSVKTDVVIVEIDASTVTVMEDGELTYYGFENDIPEALVASCRGTLLLNSNGKINGFVPNDETRIIVDVSEVNASEVKSTSGIYYSVPSYADVIIDEDYYVYGTSYYSLDGYAALTLCYGEDGVVDLVLPQTGGYIDGYQLYGYFEGADPNPSQPEYITILGAEIEVNDDIAKNFGSFAYGEKIVVTLDASGEIVDVKNYTSTTDLQAMYGIYDSSDSIVQLTSGITLTGDITVGSTVQDGQLVKVVPTANGEFSIYTCNVSTQYSLNLNYNTLGAYQLSDNVVIYECVANGPATKITLEDITVDTVSNKNIMYYNVNSDGQADLILLQDVTGNCYDYGIIISAKDKTSYSDLVDGYGGTIKKSIDYNTFVIVNGDGKTTEATDGFWYGYDGLIGGIVVSSDGTIQGKMLLESTGELDRSVLSGTDSLVADGIRYDIADDVQVLCGVTESWTTLETAMVFADTFVAYYDKAPEEGGKIRVICTFGND